MTIEYLLKSKNGHHYIYIALYQGDDMVQVSTGEKTTLKEWNKTQRRPHNQDSQTAIAIGKIKDDLNRVRRLMAAQDMGITPYAVRQRYLDEKRGKVAVQKEADNSNKVSAASIVALIEKWKKEGFGEYVPSTAAVVKTSINAFKKFIKSRYPKLERKELTLQIIAEYSTHLEKTLKDSTHGKRMKHLRWFLKWVGFDAAKIREIKVRTVKPGERNIIHLTMDELQALEAVDVSGSVEQQKAKDMFLLGCYTGLRVSDLKRINKHRIHNNSIELTLKKNRTTVSIPILPQAEEILKRYDYSSPNIAEQQVNQSIKLVCAAALIDKPTFHKSKKSGNLIEVLKPKHKLITTHCAGKTFISLASERWGLTPQDISAIVGKDIKTILGYYLKPDIETAKQKMIQAENRAKMKVV